MFFLCFTGTSHRSWEVVLCIVLRGPADAEVSRGECLCKKPYKGFVFCFFSGIRDMFCTQHRYLAPCTQHLERGCWDSEHISNHAVWHCRHHSDKESDAASRLVTFASMMSLGFCRSSVQPIEALDQASTLVAFRFQSKLNDTNVSGTIEVGTMVNGAKRTCRCQ